VRPNGHPRRGGPAVLPAGVAKLLFLWMRRDESGEMEGKRERRSGLPGRRIYR